jgi:hypothetical protein
MPDLGDITIIEKPLIIREAKVGGRKLTKALYLQLPSEEYYPTCREGVRIVAWLESHWKDCDMEQVDWSECLRTHRHVLLGEGDKPLRGTVFRPFTPSAPIELDGDGAKAFRAVVARQVMKGAKHEAKRTFDGDLRFEMQHDYRGEKVRIYETFIDDEHPARLSYLAIAKLAANPPDPPATLVKASQPAVEYEALVSAIEKQIQQTKEWRQTLQDVWNLVNEETPQVFI